MKTKFFTTLIVCSSTLIAAVQLENIDVVSTSGIALSKNDTTENSIIITDEDIKRLGAFSIGEVLSRVANISFTSNGTYGQASSFYLRGFDSAKTLVLIDGVRMNDITGLNGAQFEHIALNDVARIEIIKGAQSGLWGADASAGVINIITKQATKGIHASFSQSYASFDTLQNSAMVSVKKSAFDVKLAASSLATKGISAAEPKKGSANFGTRGYELDGFNRDKYTNQSYTLDTTYHVSDATKIKARMHAIVSNSAYDAGAGSDGNNTMNVANNFYTLQGMHTQGNHRIDMQYNLSDFSRDLGIGKDYVGAVHELKATDTISYLSASHLVIGANYQRHTQNKNYGALFEYTQTTKAGYIANYNKLGDTVVTQTLRYDYLSTQESAITGKLGAKHTIDDFYMSANYGTGYNMPTLFQRYTQWGGNAGLLPEKTQGYDVTLGHTWAHITYFHNEIENLIEYDNTYNYVNAQSKSIIKGIEISAQHAIKDVYDVRAHYTFLSARDKDGVLLARRPRHQAVVNLNNYWHKSFSTLLNVKYIGTRYDDKQATIQTGEYVLANVTANFHYDDYELFAGAYNLFNTFYQTVDGYGTMGFNFKAGLRASF